MCLNDIPPICHVELEGIEPSSKRGNRMLSTCLSLPSIFVRKQDQSHQLTPYPLNLHHCSEANNGYFRFCCTTISTSFGKTAFGWCLVSAPCAEIKLIYCTSIKQRERNEFRQIKFWGLRFKCQSTKHCMLTYHLCPLSNPVNPIVGSRNFGRKGSLFF